MTYILVEGKEDKIFINHILLNILQKDKNSFIIEHNGNKDTEGSHGIIESKAEQIEKYLLKNTDILIINDADVSYENRIKELKNKINEKILPKAIKKIKNKNPMLPNINIFLYPDNQNNGIFEDMLLKCIPIGHKIPGCFDKFVSCLSEIKEDYNIDLPVTKTKIYSYVDLQKNSFKNNKQKYNRDKDSSYFYRNSDIWIFNNKTIENLFNFLHENVN